MIAWIRAFREADPKTKSFIFNWAIYGIAIIVTTIYCYGRLDFDRTGKPQKAQEETP